MRFLSFIVVFLIFISSGLASCREVLVFEGIGGPLPTAEVSLEWNNGRFGERGQKSASSLVKGIYELAANSHQPQPEIQIRLVDELPLDLFSGSSQKSLATVVSMVSFVMRSKELEEFHSIVNGEAIASALGPDHFRSLFLKLMAIMFECNERGDCQTKYKDDWGVSLTATSTSHPESIYAILETFQQHLYRRSYFEWPDRIERWLNRSFKVEQIKMEELELMASTIAEARWNIPWDELLGPDYASDLPRIKLEPPLLEWLGSTTNLALKMLFFDYQKQLAYFDNARASSRIFEAQLRAIRSIKALYEAGINDEDIADLMRTFLLESGLWRNALTNFELR